MYNITGGKDLTLAEVNRVSEVVTSLADPSANVIFGAVIDDQYEGEIHVTIIATGFSHTFEENLLSGRIPQASAVQSAGKAVPRGGGIGGVYDSWMGQSAGSGGGKDGLAEVAARSTGRGHLGF